MQSFPEDFNQQESYTIRKKTQHDSLCKCRQTIYDITCSNRRHGYDATIFNMPSDLGRIYEIMLCEEILGRFPSLDIEFNFAHKDAEETGPTRTFKNSEEMHKYIDKHQQDIPSIVSIKFYY